jgi:ABC-type sugar transport system ATPase subunit
MNLLPGTVVTDAPVGPALAVAPGVLVALPGEPPAPAGHRLVLGIRPQDLRAVAADEPGTTGGEVFAFEPLQEVGRLTVALPGVEGRVVVETYHDARFDHGTPVGLSFAPRRTHLFDAETGARLAWQPRADPTPTDRSRSLSQVTSSS